MCGPKPYGSFFVYFAAFLGSFLTISYGFMFGMTPPTLLLYKSEYTPLSNGPLSNDSISWITTYLCMGAAFGAVFFKHLSDCFGRRATLMLAGIIENLGWFGAAFGYNFTHICISRLIVGLSGGCALTVLPLFLIEISKTKHIEGAYITTYIFQGFGIMFGYIFGTFADVIVTAIAGLVISVLFSLCFPFVQESPYHYLKKNDMTMLEKSVRYFRAIRDLDQRSLPEFLAEVDKFRQNRKLMNGNSVPKKNGVENRVVYDDGSSPRKVKSFVSCLILVITSQLCGLLTILNYSSFIFESVGSALPVYVSSMLLGAATFVGGLLSILIATCSWRKFIISAFSLLVGFCLATIGCFVYTEGWTVSSVDMNWVPLVCLVLYVLLTSASIYPMTFIVVAEVFSHKMADMVGSFYYLLHWVLGLLLIKFHFCIVDCIGLDIYFWIFSSFCIFQSVVLVFILPKKPQRNL